jgi:hypothetical protein
MAAVMQEGQQLQHGHPPPQRPPWGVDAAMTRLQSPITTATISLQQATPALQQATCRAGSAPLKPLLRISAGRG